MKGYCRYCGNYTEYGHSLDHPWLVDDRKREMICDNCFQKIGEDVSPERKQTEVIKTADQEYIDATDGKSLRAAEKKLRSYKFWRKL